MKVRKRINHKKLHNMLEMMGFEVFTCDYAYGTHCYQIIGNGLQGEYFIKKKQGKQRLDAFGLPNEIKSFIIAYYLEQGIEQI